MSPPTPSRDIYISALIIFAIQLPPIRPLHAAPHCRLPANTSLERPYFLLALINLHAQVFRRARR
jgi:hypothetical protein